MPRYEYRTKGSAHPGFSWTQSLGLADFVTCSCRPFYPLMCKCMPVYPIDHKADQCYIAFAMFETRLTHMKDNDTELLTERVITPMTKAMLARISDYRFEKRFDARADAIRSLIEIGLAHKEPTAPLPDIEVLKERLLDLEAPKEAADWQLGVLNPLTNEILKLLDLIGAQAKAA